MIATEQFTAEDLNLSRCVWSCFNGVVLLKTMYSSLSHNILRLFHVFNDLSCCKNKVRYFIFKFEGLFSRLYV